MSLGLGLGRSGAPPPVDRDSKVNACRREQQVMRQYPEPFTDIQSSEECREARCQVEIGKCIVKKLGEPYFLVSKLARDAGDLLRFRQCHRLPCSLANHWWYHIPCNYKEAYAMSERKTVKVLTVRCATSGIALSAFLVAKTGITYSDDVAVA